MTRWRRPTGRKVTCFVCGRHVRPRPSGTSAGLPKKHFPLSGGQAAVQAYSKVWYNKWRDCPGSRSTHLRIFKRLFPKHVTPHPYVTTEKPLA